MRTLLVGVMVMIIGVIGVRPATADDSGTCVEIHCYCNGPDQPDTVGGCDTTCDAVCGGSYSGAQPGQTKGLSVFGLTVIALVVILVTGYLLWDSVKSSESSSMLQLPELDASTPAPGGLTFRF